MLSILVHAGEHRLDAAVISRHPRDFANSAETLAW